ncbi:Predicted dehydrogenase [Chryseolinea serpens]|jgi:predicted dehydrogenase|uniref:Predicted dehydrogenase n=1 Tax=Chryseolinea serpens TaxID=947013 RepID=A0A1M5KBF8_9BACT|nr:Gfo/Idh/MocA family oxidoreductase [Chryseolinea serpens]SHG49503.1 Predicted dehydrogenase [Chryseolinea serpens]
MKRKLRMGMVGGGLTSFIGPVHRKAAGIDGEIELVCGAFSVVPGESKQTGEALYLNPKRVYETYQEMFEIEKNMPPDQRIDFVSVVTPNHVHFGPSKMALESGFHVIVEKPIAFSLEEAKTLQKVVAKTGLILGLTHTYTGYPLVKEARNMVSSGKLGKIRKVFVEYPQGWLSTLLEGTGNMQASWRTDPKQSGMGGAIGDIGTHAANLAEYITGSNITEVCAMLNAVVKGRKLDDDASMLIKFDNGATGVLMATQVAAGEENNLNIRVYGEKGGLEWKQEDPNTMIVKWLDRPKEIIRAGQKYLSDDAKAFTRTPAGHPEGYLEAFANIYRAFGRAVRDYKPGKKINAAKYDFPDVEDGVRGMNFVQTAVKSGNSTRKWTKLK